MPEIRRIAADWLNEPLGGARLREMMAERSSASEPDDRAVKDVAPSAVKEVAPSGVKDVATVTVELHLHANLELDREPEEWAIGTFDREQDSITAFAREAAHELLGESADCRLVHLRRGSIITEFAVTVTGALPANVRSGLDALTVRLREQLRGRFGGAVSWATATWAPGPALVPAPAPEAPEAGDVQLAKWLLGGSAFLAACLAAVKISDADLLHARLNYPWPFSAAFGVIVFGALVAVLWPAWQARGGVKRFVMLGLTGVVALVGIGVMAIVGMTNDGLSHPIRPRIDGHLSTAAGTTRLTGSVMTDGIPNKRSVTVTVSGVRDDRTTEALVVSKTGADRDGKAEVKLDAEVDPLRYAAVTVEAAGDSEASDDPVADCRAPGAHVACLTLPLRPRAARPRLAAVWHMVKGQGPSLTIHAQASGLSRGDRLLLSIREPVKPGSSDGAPGRIYAATWVPDDSGVVDEKLDVPVGAMRRRLCVVLRGLPATVPQASSDARYGPCGDRRRGVSVLVGRPPV